MRLFDVVNGARTVALSALVAGALSLGTASADAAETYAFDPGHTEIVFSYDHMGMSTQSGQFGSYEGTLTLDRDDPTNSSINVTIQADSIDTGVEALDNHLKSGDFFEVETHPTITFQSTGVVMTGLQRAQITGDLSMHGVTKSVTIDVALRHDGDHPLAQYVEAYAGANYVTFEGQTQVLRSEFGLGMFAPLTADRITISINAEMRGQN
jgi:polyisoprenoid-binding protein YceI